MESWYSSTSSTSNYVEYIPWTICPVRTKKAQKAKEKEKEPTILKKIEPVYFDPKDLCL